MRRNRINPAVFRMFSISPWSVFCRLRGFFAFNEIDRFHLVKDALLHLSQLGNRGAYLIQQMNDKLVANKNYIHEIGQDMPEILDWKWHLPENK